jgi:hypothetical protein
MKPRKLIFDALFVLVAVGIGLALSAEPWRVYQKQKQSAVMAEKIKNTAEANREELTRRKAQYDSELGKEELARNRGYRQANETPVQENIQAND